LFRWRQGEEDMRGGGEACELAMALTDRLLLD
jgi:hypothetical protein